MISVVCLKWGNLYGSEYVTRLRDGVARNMTVEHEFVCVTDSVLGLPGDMERIILRPGLDTWWGKIWLFSEEVQRMLNGERVLFLDLDTIIIDNIDFIGRDIQPFTILRGFGFKHRFGSAVIAWHRGDWSYIWDWYVEDPEKAQWLSAQFGDGAWMQLCMGAANVRFWQDLYPDKFVSLKFHCPVIEDGPPKGAAVVCFHGEPRPHQVDIGWVHDAWRGPWPKAA